MYARNKKSLSPWSLSLFETRDMEGPKNCFEISEFEVEFDSGDTSDLIRTLERNKREVRTFFRDVFPLFKLE